ncbi:MAG: phosphatase PAP2 family protein, partial [Bdellovibrionota bacterium]
IPGAILGGAFWIYGDTKENPLATHAGQAQLESLLATTVLVSAMKQVTARQRPNGDPGALPSAHVAHVFATGAVLNEFYGWKAGAPVYALGVLTAVGRMQDDRHWLSDTVGGAAVAIFIGRAFARSHLKQHETAQSEPTESSVRVQPLLGPGSLGVALHWEF